MKRLYVGIDSAKGKHECVLMDEMGNVICHVSAIPDTDNGMKRLYNAVDKACDGYANVEVYYGIEATSIYHLPLYRQLVSDGKNVKLFNPYQVHNFRKLRIRKTKADSVDAEVIADMLRYDHMLDESVKAPTLSNLRELARLRYRLVRKMSDNKRQICRAIDIIWPGYRNLFSEIWVATSIAVLEMYTTPAKLLEASEEELCSLLRRSSKGRLGSEKARELREHARHTLSVQPLNEVCVLEIKMLLDLNKRIEKHIERIDAQLKKHMTKLKSPLLTIPGISETLGAIILGEIGDIHRFHSADALVAFAGLDPAIHQSGKRQTAGLKISKRGPPLLRWALYQAATVACRCNPVCKRVFNRAIARGKHYKVAIVATARKLTRIIYSVLINNKPFYDPEKD